MKNIENTSIGEEVMESNFKIDFGTITVDEFAKAIGRRKFSSFWKSLPIT